tara:strand:- start:3653 stop:4762 length:1110 start_codon:yes stop_codon:yes gene_type:complete
MTNKTLYFPNLDASRFFAFLIVILAHCFVSSDETIKTSELFLSVFNWGKLGILGLDYFFVLSSFLISWNILSEKKNTGEFNIINFLIRRTLRIWPLYFVILSLGYGYFWFFSEANGTEPLPELYHFLFFIINFYVIDNGSNFLFFLVFLWSISIEEQFYLFWAILIKFFKINLKWLSIVLIVISIIFRFFNMNDNTTLYFHTLSTLGNFGVGGLIAYISFNKTFFYTLIRHIKKEISVIIFITLLVSILFYPWLIEYQYFKLFSKLYYSLLFGYYIMEQSFAKNKVMNPSKNKFITYIGKISYGLYCYHGVVITLLIKALGLLKFQETYWHTFLLYPVFIAVVTIAISHLSYRYFESYFLRLKTKKFTS